jgi:hypothetical protein
LAPSMIDWEVSLDQATSTQVMQNATNAPNPQELRPLPTAL